MPPLGHHSRFHLQDNRAILYDADQRRQVARIVLEQGRPDGLLAFSFPDTHAHLLPRCDARAANRLNQRIESSLKQRLNLPVSFVSYPLEPIRLQLGCQQTGAGSTLPCDKGDHFSHSI